VTGAGQGLGRAFALSLGDEGARVVIADLNRDRAESVCAELGPDRALAVEVDVSAADSVQHLREVTLAKFGTVDVLVNNAAVFSTLTMRPFDEIPVAEWDHVMAVNVRGAFLCAQQFAPAMRRSGYGKIINISSATVFLGRPLYLHYVTSKAAIIGMTRALASEGVVRHHGQRDSPGGDRDRDTKGDGHAGSGRTDHLRSGDQATRGSR
jgi:3-oxoacyl-[acyl-carrier protein] reductase